MASLLKRTAVDRIAGERPGAPRAFGAAVVVGTAAAVITYRLLRHEGADA
jgi:hypothetical protein